MINLHTEFNDLPPGQTPHDFRKKFSQIASLSRIQDGGDISGAMDPFLKIACSDTKVPML
jgi:hypothetical protein